MAALITTPPRQNGRRYICCQRCSTRGGSWPTSNCPSRSPNPAPPPLPPGPPVAGVERQLPHLRLLRRDVRRLKYLHTVEAVLAGQKRLLVPGHPGGQVGPLT